MATLTLTIPAAQVARVLTNMCAAGGYTGSTSDQAAMTTFVRQMLITYVRSTVITVDFATAEAAAAAAVPAPVDPGLT